jgi:protein-S-isoprenylcysteine O-methyltransferase Ste14
MPSVMLRAFTVLRGAIYSAVFVWFWSGIAVAVRRYDSKIPFSLPPWLRPFGFVLAAAGAALAAACIVTFVTRGRGTPAPFDPPREFVAVGPYRWVRNPMYVGATAVIGGAALILSSPSMLLLAVVFILIMHLFVVLHEEPSLTERFGVPYERYRSSVHRWLIRFPKASLEGA